MRNRNVKNILIVDDCPNDQKLITMLLQRSFDCNIHTVDSMMIAKVKLFTEKFDIITLDGHLPCPITGGYGHKLIPWIKEHQNSECEIIMISGERSYIITGIELGAHGGINKSDIKEKMELHQKLNKQFDFVPVEMV